jgi:hypothetical protein
MEEIEELWEEKDRWRDMGKTVGRKGTSYIFGLEY